MAVGAFTHECGHIECLVACLSHHGARSRCSCLVYVEMVEVGSVVIIPCESYVAFLLAEHAGCGKILHFYRCRSIGNGQHCKLAELQLVVVHVFCRLYVEGYHVYGFAVETRKVVLVNRPTVLLACRGGLCHCHVGSGRAFCRELQFHASGGARLVHEAQCSAVGHGYHGLVQAHEMVARGEAAVHAYARPEIPSVVPVDVGTQCALVFYPPAPCGHYALHATVIPVLHARFCAFNETVFANAHAERANEGHAIYHRAFKHAV